MSSKALCVRAGTRASTIRSYARGRAPVSLRYGSFCPERKRLQEPTTRHSDALNGISQLNLFHTSARRRIEAKRSPEPLVPYAAPTVSLPIDGVECEFSALLLRDLCECPSCVHESSKQRLFSTAEIPPEVRARSIKPASESFEITWSGDAPGFDDTHTTVLSIDALRDLNDNGAVSGPCQKALDSPVSWGRDDEPARDVKFQDYMKDDSVLRQAIKHLHTHGLLFVTDIPHNEEALIEIATRIGPMKDTFYGLTWDGFRTVPSAINAAYTSNDLGFHTDLLYFQNPPHIQLLHCIQSSSSGGASVFADAFKSAVELMQTDPDAFDTLVSVPVNYHYNHPSANLYHTTKPVFELRPLRIGDTTYRTVSEYLEAWKQEQAKGRALPNITLVDCLEKINWGPPFMAPFTLQEQSGQPAYGSTNSRKTLNQKVDRWHAAARKFSALLHRPDSLYERLMQPGECVLFNNTRTLHARRGFHHSDVGKTRWLKGGYVDKDPFLSKLRVLDFQLEK